MTLTSLRIDVVVLVHTETGEIRVEFVSPAAGATSLELWRGQQTGRHFVYTQDAYYNDTLAARFNSGNMIAPSRPLERLTLIARLWGNLTCDPNDYAEITHSRLDLRSVPIDEV